MKNQIDRLAYVRSFVALVFGVLSLAISVFVPFAALLGIIGMVFGWRVRKGVHRHIAIWGMICSVLAIIWLIFVFISPAFPHLYPFDVILHSSSSTH